MPRKTFAFTFPTELVEEIDRIRGYAPRSRIVEDYIRIGMEFENGRNATTVQ